MRQAARAQLTAWRDEGRVPPGVAGQLLRLGADAWPQDGLRVWTHDDDDHQRVAGWLRDWEAENASQDTDEEEHIPDTPEAPAQPTLPGIEDSPETDEAERACPKTENAAACRGEKTAPASGLPGVHAATHHRAATHHPRAGA